MTGGSKTPNPNYHLPNTNSEGLVERVLPTAVASDPGRLARFAREAQLLATLNHPHIAAIYGVRGELAEFRK